jgi:hypothetical protein
VWGLGYGNAGVWWWVMIGEVVEREESWVSGAWVREGEDRWMWGCEHIICNVFRASDCAGVSMWLSHGAMWFSSLLSSANSSLSSFVIWSVWILSQSLFGALVTLSYHSFIQYPLVPPLHMNSEWRWYSKYTWSETWDIRVYLTLS